MMTVTDEKSPIAELAARPPAPELRTQIEGEYLGLPYRGPSLNLRDSDPAARKPSLEQKVHVEVLDLANPEQLKRYEEISGRVAAALDRPEPAAHMGAQLSFEKIEFIPARESWMVLVRWIERWYGAPRDMTAAATAPKIPER